LYRYIKGLSVDEEGRISVEDLSGLVSELITREFKEWDGDEDDGDDTNEEDKAKAEAAIEAMRCEVSGAELDDKKEGAGDGGAKKSEKIAEAEATNKPAN
jgi:hypothetical protein